MFGRSIAHGHAQLIRPCLLHRHVDDIDKAALEHVLMRALVARPSERGVVFINRLPCVAKEQGEHVEFGAIRAVGLLLEGQVAPVYVEQRAQKSAGLRVVPEERREPHADRVRAEGRTERAVELRLAPDALRLRLFIREAVEAVARAYLQTRTFDAYVELMKAAPARRGVEGCRVGPVADQVEAFLIVEHAPHARTE